MSWEELCQKFAEVCGPNMQIRCAYADLTAEFIVTMWVKPGWDTFHRSLFHIRSSPREAAHELFFKKAIVQHFKDNCVKLEADVREALSILNFSSEEELILKLEVM